MSIIKDLTPKSEEWKQVAFIIYNVILNRKYKFDLSIILDKIKEELISNNFDLSITDCSYFYIILFDILDKLVNDGKVYKIEEKNIFIPVDYIIYNDYKPILGDLLYFFNENNKYYFKNIENDKIVFNPKNEDFVLCGGLSSDKYTLQTDVSFDDISLLFHTFIDEGASREEAINHILNFYKARIISRSDSYANDFVINNNVNIKKLTKKK